jgi:hypothetical protein
MSETLTIVDYPKEHPYVGRSVALSIGIHILVSALVCLITYLLGISTLKDLLSKGGAIAESGPAPEQQIIVELVKDEILPPPTLNPLFIKQIIKPKVTPPPPKPQPKPEPKPVPKPPPHFTAKNAQGEGKSQAVSVARVGTSGLPAPSYPTQARDAGQEGTVGMQITFGADGSVADAEVVQSSGVTLLYFGIHK